MGTYTVHILSRSLVMGATWCRTLSFLILEIALWTWTRTEATFLVEVSSASDSCSFSLRNGGIFSVTPDGRSHSMSNTLSAITWSPASNRLSIPQSLMIFLSLFLLAYRLDTKLGYSFGEIPTLEILTCCRRVSSDRPHIDYKGMPSHSYIMYAYVTFLGPLTLCLLHLHDPNPRGH